MIETLILGALAVASAFITGYLIGKNTADSICKTYFGWKVDAFKNPISDVFVVDITKGEKRFSVLFDLAKSRVNWLAKDVIYE